MPFIVGETVGPYRIMEQLGQGGMASVFKAYHPALDRYVAIKAMHPAFMEDPNFLARFQREAQVIARLEHPHIVPIYDFAEHEGRPYLVMKYIPGETLKSRLQRGPLDEREILLVVEAVGAALSYAHERGILHRDIKPSNVLLAEDDGVFLADFGLARIAEAGASTLSSDVMLGTPQYISPEQAMGKHDLDAGTDIYSFGVMLYELVVGKVPFSADTPYSIIHDHIYTPLPMPRARKPQISEPVERVLLKSLAKDRQDRFENIDSQQGAFVQALRGETIHLEPLPGAAEDTRATPPPDGPQAGRDAEVYAESGARAGVAPLPAASPVTADDQPARRRWRWWYALPLLLGLCFCGLIAISLLSEEGAPGALPPPDQTEATPETDRPGNPGDAPLDPVAAAQQVVRENPDDPFAHFELALALFEAGELDMAQEELQVGAELAGDNPDYFLVAAEALAERDEWVLAAGIYLRLAAMLGREMPPDLRERLEMSVYLAAQEPNARLIFGVGERLGEINPLLADTARARFNLYQDRIEIAEAQLEGVLERDPGYLPAQLMQAEILFFRGEPDPAREILERLMQLQEPPHWVAGVAEVYIREMDQP